MNILARTLLAVAVVTIAVSCSFATERAGTVRTWNVAGAERQALVFEPVEKTKTGKAPLVLVFHGHGGTMRSSARGMGIQNLWPQAIVVCMQGLPTPSLLVDPQGLKAGWQRTAGDQQDRDLKFVDEVLATLRKEQPVDDARIYATGFSNGAAFCYLLWAERASTFAAFAPCAGAIRPPMRLTEPKPVLHIAGEADPLVPIAVAQQTIETDRELNGTTGKGEPISQGVTLYRSSKGAPVETLIHSGGHLIPPGAPESIVKFFHEHELMH